jgi:Heavy metal binding domain
LFVRGAVYFRKTVKTKLLIVPILILLAGFVSAAQKAAVPPLLWSCPMHPDVLEERKGKCPICKMNLTPVRLDYVWSCPVHSVIDEANPGKCPICRRDLVQMTVSLTFTCADRPKINSVNPGKCSDGTNMIRRHTARAHGNHSPQHGGLFFMAADNWHHLEGTVPEDNVFRLHLYDDYSKALPTDQMKQASGVVEKQGAAFPLRLSADGKYLEAKVNGLVPPAEVAAKVRFKAGGPEYRFDFAFQQISQDRNSTTAAAGVMSALAIDIPEKAADILALLSERNRQIQELIEKGSFGEIYVPAFQAKDLALALELQTKQMSVKAQKTVTLATERLVRSAWQLDAYGDLGDRNLITGAYEVFSNAVKELEAAFGTGR